MQRLFFASLTFFIINPLHLSNIESDVLLIRNERYPINDTTEALSDMLYLNDAENNPNILYKYNLVLSSFTDTIIVDGNVRDINFY